MTVGYVLNDAFLRVLVVPLKMCTSFDIGWGIRIRVLRYLGGAA